MPFCALDFERKFFLSVSVGIDSNFGELRNSIEFCGVDAFS
ncbi:unnamed protein product [Amoebophrya sp. A120]|nr:unnamed protein product [Amoebophrya sp. A120]|eukprot:GSA120T00011077001.1